MNGHNTQTLGWSIHTNDNFTTYHTINLINKDLHRLIIIVFKEHMRFKICNFRSRYIYGQSIDYTKAYYP